MNRRPARGLENSAPPATMARREDVAFLDRETAGGVLGDHL